MKKRITIRNNAYSEDNLPENQSKNVPHNDINLLEVLGKILKYKKFILALVLVAMAIATIKVLLSPSIYQSRASLLPSGKVDKLTQFKQLAGLGSLAAADDNSSELFPVILRSRAIRTAVIEKKYRFNHDGEEMLMTLAEYLGQTNPDILMSGLENMTSISQNSNGVIEITVSTTYPQLSQQIVQAYIDQLEDYNRYKRQSRARENEHYLAGQIKMTGKELALAEDRLEKFQLTNSDWSFTTDPTTLKELSRMKREVEARSKALLFLMQEHGIAKQEVHKNIPIVRILDEPSLPALKTGPQRKIIVLLSGFVTLLGAILSILIAEAINKKRQGPDRHSYEFLRENFAHAFPRTDRVINRITGYTREKINA